MKRAYFFPSIILCCLVMASCVSKKEFQEMKHNYEKELDLANQDLGKAGKKINTLMAQLSACEKQVASLKGDNRTSSSTLSVKEEQVRDLKAQIADLKKQRDKQSQTLEGLTEVSKTANEGINKSLEQLGQKDKYIHLLQSAKSRTDSINLALAVNLKSVLKDGITDDDVEIKVEKTVVFINLSDKMLYKSGSATITPRAKTVLGKIAKIIESRPGLEVMVEGHTDNIPIKKACFEDNWDLSTKRASAVIRVLQREFNVDPKRMIAAGRGEYEPLTTNDTYEGRTTNRRTRILIMPKLDEFYDLLNPDNMPK